MIPIRERFEIPASPETVWPLLSDPSFVVTCVPGATLVADHGDDSYDGVLAVKFGPVTATFRGRATISFDHAARGCTIEARGQDQKGASRATASAQVTTSGDITTVVSIDGGFQVSGPLGQFARTGGQHLAREMLAEFSTNLAERLRVSAEGPAAAEGAPPVVHAPARQLSGFDLIWRALRSWARGAFGRTPS